MNGDCWSEGIRGGLAHSATSVPRDAESLYQQNLAKRNSRITLYIALGALVVGNFIGGFVGYEIGRDRGKVIENRRCVQELKSQADAYNAASDDMAEDPERREELRGIASDLNNAARSIEIYGETQDAED